MFNRFARQNHMENYQDRMEALIAGLYQKAIKERNDGHTERWTYLQTQNRIAGGNSLELGFFLDGDTVGYTPEIDVVDVNSGFVDRLCMPVMLEKRSSRLMLGIAGLMLGAGLGLCAACVFDKPVLRLENVVAQRSVPDFTDNYSNYNTR